MKTRNLTTEKLPAAGFEIRFRFTDGGRSQSKRPREKRDCTVRALALVCEVSYDEAYEFLAAHGRRPNEGFEYWNRFLDRQAVIFGRRITKHSFPALKNRKRMRPDRFLAEYPKGRFILTFSDHVAPVLDGVLWDEVADYLDKVVYTAYEFTKKTKE
jgi:hypothetical protein